MGSYKKVQLDMTCNRVLSDVKRSVTYDSRSF